MKHAVITGGSSGIGRAIAHRLWQQGYDLTLMARRADVLADTQSVLMHQSHRSGQSVLTISMDVSQQDQVRAAFEQSFARFGSVELLVNSAGTAIPGEFLTQPMTVAEQTMAINFFGSLYASHAVLPSMVARQQGHVVFVSSGVGLIGLYGYCSYSPSKFAVRGLAESLRAEMKPHGVSISIVYPPDTDTPQLQRENASKPQVTQKLSESAQLLSADQVAKTVMDGITRRQFVITPGLEMTLLNRFHSLLHPWLNRYFDRTIRKTLTSTKRESP